MKLYRNFYEGKINKKKLEKLISLSKEFISTSLVTICLSAAFFQLLSLSEKRSMDVLTYSNDLIYSDIEQDVSIKFKDKGMNGKFNVNSKLFDTIDVNEYLTNGVFISNNIDSTLEIEYDLSIISYKEILEKLPIHTDVKSFSCLSVKSELFSNIDICENFTNELASLIATKFPNLEVLKIYTDKIEKGSLEQLKSLKTLELKIPNNKKASIGGNINTDFTKLTHLESLVIDDLEYNIPIYLTLDEYLELVNSDTKVTLNKGEEYMTTYFSICNRLEQIIESFNITEEMSPMEKIDKVSSYVIENLEYTREKNKIENFYEKGDLYPVFFDKNNVICGNYAALTDALLHRIFSKERCNTAVSMSHIWNVIELDETYHLDLCWSDNANVTVIESDIEQLICGDVISIQQALNLDVDFYCNWYMQPLNNIISNDTSGSHDAINVSDLYIETIKKSRMRLITMFFCLNLICPAAYIILKNLSNKQKETNDDEKTK